MIGDAPIKSAKQIKRHLPNRGFAMVKNPPKLIQIPPAIFHPMLGNNY
jgi:hypothetical protein